MCCHKKASAGKKSDLISAKKCVHYFNVHMYKRRTDVLS